MEIKVISHQDSFSVSIDDIKKDTMDKDSMLDLFLKSLINLKLTTQIKYIEANNLKKEEIDLKKINVQTFVMIKTLKLFIKWYADKVNKDIISFVQAWLIKEKDELYFSDLKVDLEKDDINTILTIIDSLGVKFYQKVIYYLDLYFNTNHKVMIIKTDESNSRYIISYREMNIIELDQFNSGRLNVNIAE